MNATRPDKTKECIILVRVSSKEQQDEGYSLPAQEKLLVAYCERTSISVKKIFRIAESASKSAQRTIFATMMDYVDEKDVKNIVVEKVDRFVRNFKDTVMADEWLESDETRKIHFVKDGLVLHKGSRSQEKLNWGMRVVIAKNYIDNLKEEVEKGIKEKLSQGWLPGTPPLGYINIGEVKHKIQVINIHVAPLVKLMFELYDTGNHSLSTLNEELKNQGLRSKNDRPLSKSHLYKMLTNRYYKGDLSWNGVDYGTGKHEPLVSEELFNSVQVRLKRPNPPKYNKHNPLFKGMMSCENCGKSISWEVQKGNWYGSCNTKDCYRERYARQAVLDEQITQHFEALVCPEPEIIAWVKKALRSSHSSEIELHKTSVQLLNTRYNLLQTKLDTLYEDRLEARITTEYYDTKFKEVTDERKQVLSSIERLTDTNTDYIERGINILELTQNAATIYKSLKNTRKKQGLILDIFSNIGLNGESLLCEYRKEAALVLNKVEKTKLLEDTFEHDEYGSIKQKEAFLEASRSIWLGRRDSNPRMSAPKADALPLGDAPIRLQYCTRLKRTVQLRIIARL